LTFLPVPVLVLLPVPLPLPEVAALFPLVLIPA
jgi:hypothetical protein